MSAPNCQITNCDTPSHIHTAATYPKSEEITHNPKTVGPVGLLLPPMLFSLPCYFPSPAIPTSPSSSKSMSSIIDTNNKLLVEGKLTAKAVPRQPILAPWPDCHHLQENSCHWGTASLPRSTGLFWTIFGPKNPVASTNLSRLRFLHVMQAMSHSNQVPRKSFQQQIASNHKYIIQTIQNCYAFSGVVTGSERRPTEHTAACGSTEHCLRVFEGCCHAMRIQASAALPLISLAAIALSSDGRAVVEPGIRSIWPPQA